MTDGLLTERFSDIEYNIKKIREKMANAAVKASRKFDEINLLCVSKTFDEPYINYAIDSCGIKSIGENKVQELIRKAPNLHLNGVKKHLIGHLQTNKVKKIVGFADIIESVDSVKIANEIGKYALQKGIVQDILLEINIAEEENKTGIAPSNFDEIIFEIAKIKGVKIKGIMSVPPICESEQELFKYFDKIHNIYVDNKAKKIDNVDMSILSLGMSDDYEAAILSGSTEVRIGSAIFGSRIY